MEGYMYQRKNMNKHIDFQLPLTHLSTKNSEIINFRDQKRIEHSVLYYRRVL